jgi:hypothetical protein
MNEYLTIDAFPCDEQLSAVAPALRWDAAPCSWGSTLQTGGET